MDIEKKRDFIIHTLYLLIWIGIGYLLLAYVLPLLLPFVAAFLIASLLRRPILFISTKGKIPYRWAAVFWVALFYGAAGTLISLFGIRLASSLGAVLKDLPLLYSEYLEPGLMAALENGRRLFQQVEPTRLEILEGIEAQVLESAGELVSGVSVWAMGLLSNVAVALPELLIKLMLMVISTFFIAIDYDRLTRICMENLGGKGRAFLIQSKDYAAGTLFVCFRAYLLIMSITFLELGAGLTLLGIERAWLIAGLIAVFDILPVLGTGGVMLPWSGIAVLQGRAGLAVGLLILYLAITVIRNIIEPKIVGKQLGLHPVVTLISMFIGAKLFGVLGLFGFPIGLSLMKYMRLEKTD